MSRMIRCVFIVLMSFNAGCYTVGNKDMFPIAREPLSDSQIESLALGTAKAERLTVRDDAALDAYWVRVPEARGTVVFLGGNGNEVTRPIPNLMQNLTPLHLDLVVVNYWVKGSSRPTVASSQVTVDRVIRKALEISPGPVCLLGHSLGSWFALGAASRRDLSNVVLAAVGTTPSDLTRAQAGLLRPLLWHSSEDASLHPLDGVRMARGAIAPLLIVTSSDDIDIPPSLSIEVYNSLPAMLDKRLLELHGVDHAGYFRSPEFWAAAAPFLCSAKSLR